jgi:hypothetical protein
MDLTAALRAGPALLRRRPARLLPYYLLVASAPAVARAPLVAAVAAAALYLSTTGRIAPVVERLRDLDSLEGAVGGPSPLPGDGGTAGSDAAGLSPGLTDALAGLVTPVSVGLIAAGVAAAAVVWLVARSAAGAGALAAVERGLAGADPLAAGTRGIARHWRAFVGLALVRLAVRLALLALGVGLAVGAGLAAAAGGAVALAVGVAIAVLGLALVLVWLGAELVLAFAGPAVVVDDAGALDALRGALARGRAAPAAYLLYGGTVVVGLVGVGLVAVALSLGGVARALGLLTGLVVAPVLDGLRVALYADRGAGAVAPPAAGPLARLRRGLGDGLVGLAAFLGEHPGANAASAAVLGGGAAVGWLAVAPYRLGLSPPADVAGVFGAVPVGPFLNIAANNWLVAAGAGFGGLALGAATVAALAFNGALLGGVAAGFEPLVVLALVGPHAVLELPAIVVAGGVGLHLGRVGLGALRGRRSARAVAAALGDALRVFVGLAVVLVVAAAVEAFVTPRLASVVLG